MRFYSVFITALMASGGIAAPTVSTDAADVLTPEVSAFVTELDQAFDAKVSKRCDRQRYEDCSWPCQFLGLGTRNAAVARAACRLACRHQTGC